MSRRRNHTQTIAPAQPDLPAPERGVTLNLRNPDVLRGEWDAEARKSEAVAKQDRETVTRLETEARDHELKAGQAADDEMRLMEALAEAKQRREHHSGLKDARVAEAQQVEGRAKFHEDRAADLWDAMRALPPSITADADETGGGDPAGPTRLDMTADERLDAGVANLIRAHDEDPAGEAGAA